MKKIINGKKYDTETTQKLGVFWNELSPSDFRNCTEKLYRKKTGEYFLHGKGGAMSDYSESNGNMTCGSEKIMPMTESEAKRWAEKLLSGEQYIEIFGEVEE